MPSHAEWREAAGIPFPPQPGGAGGSDLSALRRPRPACPYKKGSAFLSRGRGDTEAGCLWGFENGAGIVGRSPLPVLNYTSDEMSRAVARLTAGAANFDLVHLDSIHMICYAGSSARVVYDWHNIESEALRRYSATVASVSYTHLTLPTIYS